MLDSLRLFSPAQFSSLPDVDLEAENIRYSRAVDGAYFLFGLGLSIVWMFLVTVFLWRAAVHMARSGTD